MTRGGGAPAPSGAGPAGGTAGTPAPRPAVSRRAVLAAAAGLGAAACGGPAPAPSAPPPSGPAPPSAAPDSPGPDSPGPDSPGPPQPAPEAGCARAVARTADIPVGGGRVFPDARVVVTQPAPGEFRGFGIVCTHDGCELDSVSDGTINCPCHGSRFAITDGSVVRGPARSGLRKERIAVDGGCVVVRGGAVG